MNTSIKTHHITRLVVTRCLLLLSLLLGVFMAAALTWLMYTLIDSGNQRLNEGERIHFADFVRIKQPEKTQKRERIPDRPAITKAPPSPEIAQSNDLTQGDTIAVTHLAIDAHLDISPSAGLSFGMGDGEYLPIVKVAPVYPMQAKIRKIECECMVKYTVTTTGSVENVEVLKNYCDSEVFHKSSISAALKFKYKPRIIDGEAVKVHDVKNRFIYKLDRG